MALIHSIDPSGESKGRIDPTETRCRYTVFKDTNGTRYLRLRTFGSEDRKEAGQVNQSMLFDENAVRQLLEIITREFSAVEEQG